MMNSVLGDWRWVPDLMNANQSLLNSLRLSHIEIERCLAKLRSHILHSDRFTDRWEGNVGAKLTGVGQGGNFILLTLGDADLHREAVEATWSDGIPKHFDSTEEPWLTCWKGKVEGVREEQ